MMSLLLGVVLMTMAALLALLWPILRPQRAAGPGEPELAIYRDQLAEVDRDLARGLIRPEEAAAARIEVERRLLRAAGAAERAAAAGASSQGRMAVVLAAVLVPVLSLGLYLRLGAPELPGQPVAARQQEMPPGDGGQTPSVQEMVARLEARLASQPEDVEGWLMLGRSRNVLGNAPGAVEAYRRAQSLSPDDPRAIAGLGEALIAAAGGMVTPEAKGLLERLLQAGTTDPRARYYLALAAAQAGDGQRAIGLWRELLATAPADAPWRAQVEESVQLAARELGIDPATVIGQGPAAPEATPTASRGPSAADMAAAEAMSPEDRTEFIRGMVGRLEARLEADGGDPEGWRRLAQSRLVLGEEEEARKAYERGLALHPDDAELLKGYASLLLGPPQEPNGLPQVGDQAAELYARAAAAAPDDPEVQWFLGVRALQTGQKAEARDHWQRVLARLEPDHPDYVAVKQQLDSLGG